MKIGIIKGNHAFHQAYIGQSSSMTNKPKGTFHRGDAAGGIDHIGQEAALSKLGQLFLRLPQGAHRMLRLRPSLAEFQTFIVNIHGYYPGTGISGHRHHAQPDRTGTDNQDLIAGAKTRPPDGVRADRQRLQHRRLIQRQPFCF
ncbi:hypothetical protein D3C75_693190 [compost metagenome]